MRSRRSGEVEGGLGSGGVQRVMRSSAPAWHSAFLDTGGMTMVFASGTGSDLI